MLASLRAPHPEPPRLKPGDHRVHSILRDLDKIKGSKPKSKLHRCEQLIYFIVQSLRKCHDDHLLHTTSIWVLITLFRMFPRENKIVMLQAGVAGVLHDIIKSGSLNGSSRQYASELCFYLSSNFEYPEKFDDGKPMSSYPEVQPFNKYQSGLDDISIASLSDISSATEDIRPTRQPFVPYRIDEQNLAKMEALFSSGYEHEVAASLPKISMLSHYGFSQHDNKMFENEDDDDDGDVDDGDSIVSNLSSGSYSVIRGNDGNNFSSQGQSRLKMSAFVHSDNDSVNSFSSSLGSINSSVRGISFPTRPFTTPNKRASDFAGQSSLGSRSDADNARYQPWLGGQSNNQREVFPKPVSSAPHRMVQQLRDAHVQNIETNFDGSQRRPYTSVLGNSMSNSARRMDSDTNADMDILNFMSTLDPFSNQKSSRSQFTKTLSRLNNLDVDQSSLASDVESDEEDENDSSDSETYKQKLADEEDEEDEEANIQGNPFIQRQKMRIRAEKLIDHRFIKALFIKKMTPDETRNIIYRMGNIIQLVDTGNTGYITFEQFMKIVLSIAPSHLQRKDIVDFFQYQTDNMQNLLDYQEFLISGKVLLLTKAQHAHALKQKKMSRLKSKVLNSDYGMNETQQNPHPTTLGWLKRQKEVVGEESTYTWKNHIKWFQRRQGSALIWLIRRAVRALDYESTLIGAQKYLLVVRKHALALNDLLDYGRAALIAQEKREVAKVHLLKRSIHARKYLVKQLNAFQYLKFTAVGAKKEIEFFDAIRGKLSGGFSNNSQDSSYEKLSDEQKQLINAKYNQQFYNKLQSVNYNKFYKIKAYQQNAIKYLRGQVEKAKLHCSVQDDCFIFFQKLVRKVQLQQSKQSKVRYELFMYGNRGLEFCLKQDEAILGLLRLGRKALNLMNNQADSLNWLLTKGQSSIQFLSAQSTTAISLAQQGRRTLAFLNKREDSFAYLTRRCSKAVTYVEKKKEATIFLRNVTNKVWKLLDEHIIAADWLQARAKRAREYIGVRQKTFQYLQFIAHKANATARRAFITQQELLQIGIVSKLQSFQIFCKNLPRKRLRLLNLIAEEKRKIRHHDQEQIKLRNQMLQNIQSVWKQNAVINNLTVDEIYKGKLQKSIDELSEKWMKMIVIEAFQTLSSYYTPSQAFQKNPLKKLESIVGSATSSKSISNPHDLFSSTNRPAEAGSIENLLNSLSQMPFNIIGKYGLRKLLQNGKLLAVDTAGVDEIFRNHDFGSSCYISIEMILPFIIKRMIKMKLPSKIISTNDVITVEERAYISVFQLCQQNQDLIEDDTPPQNNLYDEFRKKMDLRKGASKQQALSDEDSSEEDEDDELDFDDDDIFSDIEKLKKMDVGKLMRYLTRRTHDQIAKSLENNSSQDAKPPTTNTILADENDVNETKLKQ